MDQKVLSKYFNSVIEINDYLKYLILEGYHIDSFSYQLMPVKEVRYSFTVVVSK